MAKKKAIGASKTERIRQYLAEHPDATPSEVVAALNEQGVETSISLVTFIRLRNREDKTPTRKPAAREMSRRRTPRPRNIARSRGMTRIFSADDLAAVRELADRLGGLDQLRLAIETLERSSGSD